MWRLLVVSFWVSLGSQISLSQEESPPRTLRLLAVGDSPPFRQEIRNGVRYELPPPEGSVPPLRVEVSAVDSEGAEQQGKYEIDNPAEKGLRLRLNGVSSRMTVPGAAMTVRLLEEGEVWHSFELPEGGDFLIVLWRDPSTKNWSKARSRLVPDGANNFKAGDLRFINVGPVQTGFIIGDQEQFELSPGNAKIRSLGISSGTPSKVVYRDPKRGWQRLWSSALVQNRGERSTVVVYMADGEKPRRPLKVIALRERAVALSKERPGQDSTNP